MKFNRRLLELSGILRRSEKHILREGEEDEGGDDEDLFGDDDEGDDLFGDDEGEDEEGGEEETREPPEALDAQDVEQFGSPRFKEIDDFLATAFDESMKSAYVGAQELESYPGENLETPAKEEEEEPEEEKDEKEEKAEAFQSHRDKDLILEAQRLLIEAEEEGAAADDFDMEHFARRVKHLIHNYDSIMDIEGSIFNMARQMILNNFGPDTENEFTEFLARLDRETLDFTDQFQDTFSAPPAVGATGAGGGGA